MNKRPQIQYLTDGRIPCIQLEPVPIEDIVNRLFAADMVQQYLSAKYDVDKRNLYELRLYLHAVLEGKTYSEHNYLLMFVESIRLVYGQLLMKCPSSADVDVWDEITTYNVIDVLYSVEEVAHDYYHSDSVQWPYVEITPYIVSRVVDYLVGLIKESIKDGK